MKMSASINGLDIQNNYICIAQFAPLEDSVLQVAIQPLSIDSGESYWDIVAEELKSIRKIFRFRTSEVVCSLSSEQAIIKTLQVESDEPESKDILHWELSQHLVSSIDEYAFDFHEVTPGLQMDYRRYLAAAVRLEAIARLKKTVKSAKLSPAVIDLDLFALVNVFEANYPERLSDTAVLVHAENTRTRLVLTSEGSFIDHVVFDYNAAVQDEMVFCEHLRQGSAHLVSANSDVLSGGLAATYFAGSLFSNQVFTSSVLNNIPQSELLNPFRKISCTVGVDEDQLKAYSSQLAVSVGLALRGNET